MNSRAASYEGRVQYRELVRKKSSLSLTDQAEVDFWLTHQSLFFAHYLSCRQLDEFLWGEPPAKFPDDGRAWQYFPSPDDWVVAISGVPAPLQTSREQVNKALLHLTFSDPLLKEDVKEFSADYTVDVVKGLELFLRKVEGGPIDEAFRLRALDAVVRFRAWFEPIVEANTREWRARGGVPPP